MVIQISDSDGIVISFNKFTTRSGSVWIEETPSWFLKQLGIFSYDDNCCDFKRKLLCCAFAVGKGKKLCWM